MAKAEILALQKQVRELQRILGNKTVENEILREAIKVAQKKMDTSLAVIAGRGYAVKRVAEVLGVSRSQLTERLKGPAKPRSAYFKT